MCGLIELFGVQTPAQLEGIETTCAYYFEHTPGCRANTCPIKGVEENPTGGCPIKH